MNDPGLNKPGLRDEVGIYLAGRASDYHSLHTHRFFKIVNDRLHSFLFGDCLYVLLIMVEAY